MGDPKGGEGHSTTTPNQAIKFFLLFSINDYETRRLWRLLLTYPSREWRLRSEFETGATLVRGQESTSITALPYSERCCYSDMNSDLLQLCEQYFFFFFWLIQTQIQVIFCQYASISSIFILPMVEREWWLMLVIQQRFSWLSSCFMSQSLY